jgi:flagellin
MGLRVRTNVQSLTAQRHLIQSTAEQSKSTERLSSGYRINRGADDAAGFAIATTMSADIQSLAQARRNANDGVSLIEVAEGGLSEISNIMVRLRELSIQAASDTIGARERGYLNQEFFQLKDEVDRIASATSFNGTRLLTGSNELHEELVRSHNPPPLEIQVGKDYYMVSDALTNPNPIDIIRLDTSKFNAFTEGQGSLELGNTRNPDGTRIDSKQSAQISINRIDSAMEKLASYRADLGALQNRLEKTDKSLSIAMENLSTARSRVRDVDFAEETAHLTQSNILQQAGAAVLTQANSQPQIALKLLQG